MIVDTDILEAVLNQWQAMSANTLGTSLPSTRVYTGKLPAAPSMPYAQVTLERYRPDDIDSPFGYLTKRIVWRKLVIKAWADNREDAEEIAESVLESFADESEFSLSQSTVAAVVPSEPSVFEDDSRSQGSNPAWRAECEFDLMVNAKTIAEPH